MKRLKKAALAVACAAVLCSVFSGCGGDKKDTAKAAPAEERCSPFTRRAAKA